MSGSSKGEATGWRRRHVLGLRGLAAGELDAIFERAAAYKERARRGEPKSTELAGVVVSNPAKVGKDAGELAGIGPLGVPATDDVSVALADDVDCVVYAATADTRPMEAYGDLDDEENTTGFLVARDQARTGTIRLYNDEFAGGDVSNISFTITNLVQP